MIVGREVKDGKLWISHFDHDGKVRIEKITLPQSEMFEWVPSKEPTEFKTWDGSYIKKEMMSYKRQPRWKFRMEELTLACTESVKQRVHEYNKPVVTYLDIENYVNENNDFTDPEKAEFPINVMSLVQNENIIVLTTLKNMEDSEIQRMQDDVNDYFKRWNSKFVIKYLYFNEEKALLQFFSQRLLPRLSCISGWNVIEYDWQYITNRCNFYGINLLGALESQTTSGKYKLPMHIGVVDYMECFDEISPYKDLENLKLNTVADRALGVTKLKNPYKTFSEYINDTYMFIKYNIIDSCLIQYIENETNVLDSTFALCKISEVELCNVFSSVYVTEMLLCREFIKRGIMLPRTKRDEIVKEKYKGAYVGEPVPGYYENVVCFDFNSMYPNIFIMFNISPETYLGYEKDVDVSKIGSYTKTAQGTIFSTDVKSVAGVVLNKYYDERKSIQKEMRAKKALRDEKKKNVRTN